MAQYFRFTVILSRRAGLSWWMVFIALAGRAARGTQLILLDLAIILFMMVFKPFS